MVARPEGVELPTILTYCPNIGVHYMNSMNDLPKSPVKLGGRQ